MLWSIIGFLFIIHIKYRQCHASVDHSTLKQLQIISRHGARTPVDSSYPGDVNTDFLAIGLGQLTTKGSEEMYEYGLNLKKRYGNFLKNDYRTVLARSSLGTRCLQSGEAMLSAIYPRTYNPPGREGRNYDSIQSGQPIPIYTACDGMLTTPENLTGMGMSAETERLVVKLLEDAMTATGNHNLTTNDLLAMHDSVLTEKYHNLLLPSWYDALFPRINTLINDLFSTWTAIKSYSIPRAGPLFKEVTSNWVTLRISHGTRIPISTFFYFTHDGIIGCLLGLLKCPLKESPPFGATLIIEKHELADNSTLVKLFYQKTSNSQPILLNNEYCDSTLTDFSVRNLLEVYSEVLSNL